MVGQNQPERPKSKSGYQHGVPSRKKILAMIERAGQPQDFEELALRFSVATATAKNGLKRRLKLMVKDRQLVLNKKLQYDTTKGPDLVTGKVIAHRDGFGFLVPDDGSEDVYISVRDMRSLWDSDRISVRVNPGKRDNRECRLVEILERGAQQFFGRLDRKRGANTVVIQGQANSEILIPRGASGKATQGDIVQVEIVQHPTGRSRAVGRVSRVVGRAHQPRAEINLAILSHRLPCEWTDLVNAEAAALATEVSPSEKKEREDLRKLPLITIDGVDAKDFDDAVYCEPDEEGWRLIVAIADVSHYVTPNSALDEEARSRGTSVYFPGRVLPMLPEALSNGLCSLKPNLDRLCLACEMKVLASGEVTEARFFNALMRSASRLTYRESWRFLEKNGNLKNKNVGVEKNLICLRDIYKAFAEQRRRRGAMEFDLPEVVIRLDGNGKLNNFFTSERLISHRIIEECMVAANVEAAKSLKKHNIPGLFRVHDAPDEQKINELRLFLGSLGLALAPPDKLRTKDISHLVNSIAGHPQAPMITSVILRSMKQALYQPRNVGHFGLALGAYAHFTSPIRRYPDLIVHRALKWLIKHNSAKNYPYTIARMEKIGEQASLAERRADDAVREVEQRLKCIFLSHKIDESFKVLVTGVTDFGLFVQVPELQVDGLVHITSLPRDRYGVDSTGTKLTGSHTGNIYQLMDVLEVRLAHVDIDARKIDFVLSGSSDSVRSRRSKRSRQRG